MNCKYCGAALSADAHGKRTYCNDAHKQAFFRKQHQQDQAQTIDDQAREISRLREQLDVEKRWLAERNTKKRGFKTWLKKQPATPFIQKLLADSFFHVQDTRGHYEYQLQVYFYCTEDEMEEVARLWKLMLLQA